jgi:hypothetical protein
MATTASKKELKNKFFAHPDGLCEFVNSVEITIKTITQFGTGQVVYYYEK